MHFMFNHIMKSFKLDLFWSYHCFDSGGHELFVWSHYFNIKFAPRGCIPGKHSLAGLVLIYYANAHITITFTTQ